MQDVTVGLGATHVVNVINSPPLVRLSRPGPLSQHRGPACWPCPHHVVSERDTSTAHKYDVPYSSY